MPNHKTANAATMHAAAKAYSTLGLMTLPLFLHPTKNVVDSMTQVQLAAHSGRTSRRVIPNKDAIAGAKTLDTVTSGDSAAPSSSQVLSRASAVS
jgi:hypothetical protein